MFCTVNQLSNWFLHNNNIPSKWIKVSTRKTDFKKIANNTLKANSERVGNWIATGCIRVIILYEKAYTAIGRLKIKQKNKKIKSSIYICN